MANSGGAVMVIAATSRAGWCVQSSWPAASRIGSGQPAGGSGYELDSIAAVVIGGTSLFGGEGNLFASLVGALIIATLRNGLNVLGVYAFWQQVAIGVILIAAVYLDQLKRRSRERV